MPKQIAEDELAAILAAVEPHVGGASLGQIARALPPGLPEYTIARRLKHLVKAGRLITKGERRATKYLLPQAPSASGAAAQLQTKAGAEAHVPVSPAGAEIQRYLRQPVAARKPVGYNRDFLEKYRPNVQFYLSQEERARLSDAGSQSFETEAAGTHAKQILARLLIDLSWNSSRLEGNTYSLLDTRRLIEFGNEAEGSDRQETQMIINHKDAIEFLVDAAEEINFNLYTILNLHAILAYNLLQDEGAGGRVRQIGVGIESSVFHPLAVPQQIEECFNQILATAAAIEDPFEQSFFIMVQLPYLQPFVDVNKRVSRIAANIPFIRRNLSPLSFIDLPRQLYTEAILGVYELNDIALLKDVFIWAYNRSAAQYAAVRQSLGEPDPFRSKHRDALRLVVAATVRDRLDRRAVLPFLSQWSRENVAVQDREHFKEIAEIELLNLHEGNFARYQIRPSEFTDWQEVWNSKKP